MIVPLLSQLVVNETVHATVLRPLPIRVSYGSWIGGVPYPDITNHTFGIARQLYFIQHTPWALVYYYPAQFRHKVLAPAFLNDPPHLDVAFAQEVVPMQRLGSDNDVFWHADAMPGEDAPATGY